MNYMKKSSGLTTGDCLGGYVSQHPVCSVLPKVTSDTAESLEITGAHISFVPGQYIKITKTGAVFVARYYNALYPTGVVIGAASLAVGDVALLDFEYHNFYVEITRVTAGNTNGVTRVEFPRVTNAPWARPNLVLNDPTPYYSLIYLMLEAETYVDTIDGQYHYFSGVGSVDSEIIPDHLTEPSTPGADTGWTDNTVVRANLAAGIYPIWLKNTTTFSPSLFVFTDDQNTTLEITGGFSWPIYTDRKRYRIYGAYDGSTVEGALLAESNTLPINVVLTPPASGIRTYRMRLVEQTAYGVESQNILLDQEFMIDADGNDQTKPDPPTQVTNTLLQGGRIKTAITVTQPPMGRRIVFAKININGVIGYVDIVGNGTVYYVSDPFSWGTEAQVAVTTIDSSQRESDPVEETLTVAFAVGDVPWGVITHKSASTSDLALYTGLVRLADGDAVLFGEAGVGTLLYLSGEPVLYIADGEITMMPGWVLANGTVSGASTKYLEDAGGGLFYMGDGATRRMEFDTASKIITAAEFRQPLAPQCPLSGPVVVDGAKTRFQYLHQRYATWLYFVGAAVYTLDWRQTDG